MRKLITTILVVGTVMLVGVTLHNSIVIAVLLHKSPTYSQTELNQAYLTMPQLLFEDLCIEHSDWSEDQMAIYYIENIEVLSKIYPKD